MRKGQFSDAFMINAKKLTHVVKSLKGKSYVTGFYLIRCTLFLALKFATGASSISYRTQLVYRSTEHAHGSFFPCSTHYFHRSTFLPAAKRRQMVAMGANPSSAANPNSQPRSSDRRPIGSVSNSISIIATLSTSKDHVSLALLCTFN